MIKCISSLSLIISVVMSTAVAQPATDEELALSALHAALRTANSDYIPQLLEDAHSNLTERSRDPSMQDQIVGAVVVLSEGMSIDQIASLVEQSQLELVRVEFKNAIGSEGRIATMSIGSRELLLFSGSLPERIRKGIGSHQFRLGELARNASAEDAALLNDTALNPRPQIYAIEVVGPLDSIARLPHSASIAVVLLDSNGDRVQDYMQIKEIFQSQRVEGTAPIVRKLEDGPPPGVPLDRIIWRGPIPGADDISPN